ncbi:MAG: tubulin-like doman-containing protein, partial [Flavobacteriales bacterium]
MSQVLIGVGGSGQHIVLAYLRVLALGNATAAHVPHVFLIDADAQLEQNQGRQSQLVSHIKQLHDQLKQIDQNADQKPAEFEIIRPYNTTLASSSEVKVKDIVLGKSQHAPIEVQAFFNQDDLDVKLSEGMHANPKVGSTVFGEKLAKCMKGGVISVEELQPQISQQFGRLFAPHVTGSQAKPLKVVIVGSVFGGTGSGIIPTLARNLSQVLGAGSVAITTVTTLPWFSLKAGANGQQGSALNESRLQRNTSFALRNFQKQLNTQDNSAVVSSVFIQSAPQWPVIERPIAGDFDQPEHPHVINLIAAHAVQQAFIGRAFASGQMYVPVVHTDVEANQGQFSPLYSDHLKFSHSEQGHHEHLWNLLVCSDMTAYILSVAADVLDQYDQGGFEKYSKVDGLSAKSAQYVAILRLLDKIREAQGIEFESTKGTFLGIGKRQYIPNKIAQSLAKALRQVSVQLSDSLTWINKLSVQEGSTGIQPVFNDYLFANVKGTETANAEKYKQIWDRVVNSSDQTNVVQGEIAESRALKALQAMLEHSENDQLNLIQTNKAAGRLDQLDQKIADLLARQLYSVL